MENFGTVLREARKQMGWDQRSFAAALRMSDKTIAELENTGHPDRPAAQDVLDLMRAYGIEFADDYSAVTRIPALEERYFLTLDFRFDPKQDERVRAITRRMHVVGLSVVRRLNQARNTASSFDGVELHAPPINRSSLDAVLTEFVDEFGPSIDCLVRNTRGLRLTAREIPGLWDDGHGAGSG